MTYTIRTECRLCSAPLPDERVLDLGSTVLANALEPDGLLIRGPEYPLYLKQCSACGHVQLPVVVDPKLLFPADYPYCSSVGESMRKHLTSMAKQLTELVVAEDPPCTECHNRLPVAEIGSNDGFLLEQFSKLGERVVGIDPALSLARDATRRGFLTVPDFFTPDIAKAVADAMGPMGLVVANNVLAHCEDLHAIVEGVKILLDDSATLVFEVGNLRDVVRTNNFPALYHEHMSVHHIGPLVQFFDSHKMTLYDVHQVDTQGGSIRCFVRKGRAKKLTKRMNGLLAAEQDWCNPAALRKWQTRVNFAAAQLAGKLRALKAQGKSIAAYGCSAKSTTLLYVAGIGRETIDFICDSNPNKIGKFSPGKHIEVVHPDELERRQPDYCVSLSGNFSEAFRARHPSYRGEWIEPQLC